MQNTQDYGSFRISTGGLVYRLLTLLHIQDPSRYFIKRRIVFYMAISWIPLFLLALFEGHLLNPELDVPFLYDMKTYVRFLLALPLLIAADAIIDPLIASNLQSIGSSGIVGEDKKEQYFRAVKELRVRKDAYLADIVIMGIAFLVVLSFLANLEDLDVSTDFTNWVTIHENSEAKLTLAGWWFLTISSPLLQILLFRWFWRFYLWGEFLFRVSRIKLKLQATHPDLAGGLGILKNGEAAFIMIFLAFGIMFSATLAEEILYTDFTLTQSAPFIGVFIISSIIFMSLPLFFFTPQLMSTKRRGRVVYGGLGYKLSKAFDKKWGDPADPTTGSGLIKTADSSAVCDYADIYDVVRSMRYLPISPKGLVVQAIILLIPFLPLVLTEISISEVLSRILDTLI